MDIHVSWNLLHLKKRWDFLALRARKKRDFVCSLALRLLFRELCAFLDCLESYHSVTLVAEPPSGGSRCVTSLLTTTFHTTSKSISSSTTTPPLLTVPPGHLYLRFFFEVSTRQKTYVICLAWRRNPRVLGCLMSLRPRTVSSPCSMASLIHTRNGGKGSTSII